MSCKPALVAGGGDLAAAPTAPPSAAPSTRPAVARADARRRPSALCLAAASSRQRLASASFSRSCWPNKARARASRSRSRRRAAATSPSSACTRSASPLFSSASRRICRLVMAERLGDPPEPGTWATGGTTLTAAAASSSASQPAIRCSQASTRRPRSF